jgi:hypothetical protein
MTFLPFEFYSGWYRRDGVRLSLQRADQAASVANDILSDLPEFEQGRLADADQRRSGSDKGLETRRNIASPIIFLVTPKPAEFTMR